MTSEPTTTTATFREELLAFLEESWDPDLTVGEWWDRLGLAGWAAPLLPADCFGKGLSRGDGMEVARIIAGFGALGAPMGMGIGLASPTIATHGTREQIERLIPELVCGRKSICQLFSEPGAGSDLAGLTTRAVLDGEIWHVDGQKVWTSGGQYADLGMLLARTNWDVPKHQGITWFAIDMHQPGVDVRPLKEMTGHAMFNEVFLTDAQVHDRDRIGDKNNGWAAANTTLLHERSGMGAGGGGRGGGMGGRMARAGTIAGDLDKRAGDFVAPRPKRAAAAPTAEKAEKAPRKPMSGAAGLIELARTMGKDKDPAIRQRLAQLHTLTEIARLTTERHKAVRAAGGDIPGVANFSKLGAANTVRLSRDLGMEILGARGMLHTYDDNARAELIELAGVPQAAAVTAQALGAQALPIYGGTDQVQRNIIGERVLGLPKEPGDLTTVPFSQLPKNG